MTTFNPIANVEAEQSVLGSMLIEARAIDTAVLDIDRDDFYRNTHQTIFDAIVTLHMAECTVDLVTIQEELSRRGLLEAIGGISYLTSLFETVPSAANVGHYARIVTEKADLRRRRTAANEIARLCEGDYEDADDVFGACESAWEAATRRKESADDQGYDVIGLRVQDEIEARMQSAAGRLGLHVGLRAFDRLTAGLSSTAFVVLAGPTGMGKTSLALQMAEYVAITERQSVLFFEPEMTAEELYTRQVCSRARVDSRRYLLGDLSADEWERVNEAACAFHTHRLRVVCKPGMAVAQMTTIARRVRRKQGLGLIVVDGISLCNPGKSTGSREQDVAGIAYGLKAMAANLGVPVIGCHQLNDGAAARQSKAPQLSDLRESKAIGHAADIVAFLWSNAYYGVAEADADESLPADKPEAVKLSIRKHRNGRQANLDLWMDRSCTRFFDVQPGQSTLF